MSWDAVAWAFAQAPARPTDKLVMLVLANYADKNGRCYPSIAALAASSGLNKETVILAIKRLEEQGLLSRKKRFGNSVIYQLIIGGADASIPENPVFRKTPLQYSGKPPSSIPETRKLTSHEPVIEPSNTCADAHVSVACGNATSPPPCPHRKIIDLYHEILPELPCVVLKRWDGQRAKDLAVRWREDPKHQDLAFWRWYFGQVRKDRFYLGEGPRGWRADLRFLVQRKNFDKILEAAVSAQRRRAVA